MMSPGAKLILVRQSDHAQPMACAHWSVIRAPGRLCPTLQFKGFGGGVPSNTETAAVKPRAGINRSPGGVCSLLKWHGPGALNTPGPFNFPISRAPACAAESPKLSLPGAAPGRLANGVVADKECTCPASRLMWERYPPTPPISTAGNSTNAQREAS